MLHGGLSPVPAMLLSLERLHPAAAFAVIACNTAHAFFDEVERRSPVPLVHLVEEVIARIVELVGEGAQVGVLGVTATLQCQLYPKVAERVAPQLRWISLRDLDDGDHLQEALTMRPIYGPLRDDGGRARGGVKDGGVRDRETGRLHRDTLMEAIDRLHTAGARCAVAGCTEISVVLGPEAETSIPLIDPLEVAARVALAIAYGELELPRRRRLGEPDSSSPFDVSE